MEPNQIKELQEIVLLISSLLALISGLIAGLWAWAKFILERGLLPSIQFEVDFKKVGEKARNTIVEICLHIKNVGSSTLVARNIRLDALYVLKEAKQVKTFAMSKEDDKIGEIGKIGKMNFENKLSEHLKIDPKKMKPQKGFIKRGKKKQKEEDLDVLSTRGILILRYDTFVEPGVDQPYPFVTTLPIDAEYVLVWGSFEYGQKPSLFQRAILGLARFFGLIQYSLRHISETHTIERVFSLK